MWSVGGKDRRNLEDGCGVKVGDGGIVVENDEDGLVFIKRNGCWEMKDIRRVVMNG